MNKEFMLLNDNTIEVTNEEGKQINRGEFENNNVEDILLSENKIEILEKIENQLEKENVENKKVIFLSNGMLISSAVMLVLAVLGGFAYGAISHPSDYMIYGIVRSIECFSGAIIPVSVVTIYYSIVKPIYKKHIKKTEKKLNKTADMKKEYEEELIEVKQKKETKSLEPLVKISLEEKNNIIANQITEEIKQFTEENIKQKGKTRIRKR